MKVVVRIILVVKVFIIIKGFLFVLNNWLCFLKKGIKIFKVLVFKIIVIVIIFKCVEVILLW